jgi:MSHA biogenesis protein MshJ
MMHPLRHAWHVIELRLTERTPRERAILCFAALVMAYALADATVFGSGYSRLHAAGQNETKLKQELIQRQQQTQALQLMVQADPNAPYLQQKKLLEQRLVHGEEQLANIESTLVQPRQAITLLRDIIKAHPGVRIVALKLLPPQPVRDTQAGGTPAVASQASAGGDAPAEAAILLWRHDVELQLEGSYLDILAYVEALERQPWRYTWPQLKIETAAPGRARAKLTLGSYTLANTLVKL